MTADQASLLGRLLTQYGVQHLMAVHYPIVAGAGGEPEPLMGVPMEHDVVIADTADFNLTELVWALSLHGFGLRFEPKAPGARLVPIAPRVQVEEAEEVADDADWIPPRPQDNRCATCGIPLAVTGGVHAIGCPAAPPGQPGTIRAPAATTWTTGGV